MAHDPTSHHRPHGRIHFGHPDDARVPGYELDDHVAPPPTRTLLAILAIAGTLAAFVGLWMHHAAESATAVPIVHVAWVAPFAALLGCIALMPFVAPHWWEHHYAKVAIALGAIVAAYYLIALDGAGARAIAGSAAEYVSFILLLGSLYLVSGGILIRVRGRGSPVANVAMLAIGAILANVLGTTGASMVLIRPFLRLNDGHVRPYHVVFFIFVVSNCGGSLTPIGDPPLFLGFLQGVPFWWVLEHCWPIWLLVNGGLLATFFAIDTIQSRDLPRAAYDAGDVGPVVSLYGATNILWIALIVAGILLHAPINAAVGHELPTRELCMVVAAVASLALTPRRIHIENRFGYAPIREVAFLFVGIFLTMVPALNYLHHENAKPPAERRVSLDKPGQYYFASGTLSAVLDNAPTYLTFLQSKLAQLDAETVARAVAIAKRPGSAVTDADVAGLSEENAAALRATVATLLEYHGDRVNAGTLSEPETRVGFLVGDPHLNLNLVAISMGAVLFGAMTYIGNGPNFMVRAIAVNAGVPMPSFFGYVFRYSIPALLPLLVIVWAVFLR